MPQLSDSKLFSLIFLCSFLSLQSMEVQQRNNTADAYWLVDRFNVAESDLNNYPLLDKTLAQKIPYFKDLISNTNLPVGSLLTIPDTDKSSLTNFVILFRKLNEKANLKIETSDFTEDTSTLIPSLNIANFLCLKELTSIGLEKIIENNNYLQQSIKLNPDLEKVFATKAAIKLNFCDTLLSRYDAQPSQRESFYLDHKQTGIRRWIFGKEEKDILYFNPTNNITLSATYNDNGLKTLTLWTHKNFFGDFTHTLPTVNSILWRAWTVFAKKPYVSFDMQDKKIRLIDNVKSNNENTLFIIEATAESTQQEKVCYLLDITKQKPILIPNAQQCYFSTNPTELYIVNDQCQLCLFNTDNKTSSPLNELNASCTRPPLVAVNSRGHLAALFVDRGNKTVQLTMKTPQGIHSCDIIPFSDFLHGLKAVAS